MHSLREEDRRHWTTPTRARKAAGRAKELLAIQLRDHAKRLVDYAEMIEKPPGPDKEWERPGVLGFCRVEEARAVMQALAAERANSDALALRSIQGHPVHETTSALHADAKLLLASIAAFEELGEAEPGTACSMDPELAQIMRKHVGAGHFPTIRVGDRVEWPHEEGRMEGDVLAIHRGSCVVGDLLYWRGACGSSTAENVMVRAVGDVQLSRR